MTSMLLAVAVASMLQAPPNPPEMDALKPFQGTWKGNVQVSPPGEKPVNGPTTWKVTSAVGGLYLQFEVEQDLKAMGIVRGLSLITWDKRVSKYLSLTFSNNPDEVGKPRAEFVSLTGKKLEYEMPSDGKAGLGQSFEILPDGKMKYKLRLVEGEKELVIAEGTLSKT